MTTTKKIIPKVSSSCEQARDIDGIRWVVRRLTPDKALDVLSRLFSDVGEVVTDALASPDREIDPTIEAAIAGLVKKSGVSVAMIKSILFSSALSRVKDLNMRWYSENLLPGFLDANGVSIDSMDELAETGIGPIALVELVWHAIQFNFSPISAVSGTSDGGHGAVKPATNLMSGQSSLKDVRERVGQSVLTSTSIG